jgi:hypothetical protein
MSEMMNALVGLFNGEITRIKAIEILVREYFYTREQAIEIVDNAEKQKPKG